MILTLALVVFGGVVVTALLTYVGTVIRVRPPIEERNSALEGARSGIRMAITMQREHGPDGCFRDSFSSQIDGATVSVSCQDLHAHFSGLGRHALVSTADRQLHEGRANIAVTGAAATGVGVEGGVFVSAGPLDQGFEHVQPDVELSGLDAISLYAPNFTTPEPETTPEPDTTTTTEPDTTTTTTTAPPVAEPPGVCDPDGNPSEGAVCVDAPWWERIGDRAESAESWEAPMLPQVPTYLRPGAQTTIGSCQVYYPGRYQSLTGQPLVLDGGNHYFASGVYLFNDPLEIRNGANVVAGEGAHGGCSFDAAAAFAPHSPLNHQITGKGATFIFGDDARLVVQDASLRINRRASTGSTRATEGIAIMSVHHAVDTEDVRIPESMVRLPDDSASPLPVSSHSITPVLGGEAVSYQPSSVPADDSIVDVTMSGVTDRLYVEGYVVTPGAGVSISVTGPHRGLRLNGGVVASTITLDLEGSPTSSEPWLIGVISEPVKRQVRFVATTSRSGVAGRSVALFEVHRDGSYAINSWIVSG